MLEGEAEGRTDKKSEIVQESGSDGSKDRRGSRSDPREWATEDFLWTLECN